MGPLMRRLAVLLLTVCCAPEPRVPVDCDSLPNHVSVIIDGRCGGVMVTPRSILTAEHCVHGSRLSYERCDGVTDTALALHLDLWLGLGELALPEPVERIGHHRYPVKGEDAYLVHHRCSGGWCHAHGVITSVSAAGSEGMFECDCAPDTGQSGSGIFGEDDALIGIVTSVSMTSGLIYFALIPQ